MVGQQVNVDGCQINVVTWINPRVAFGRGFTSSLER